MDGILCREIVIVPADYVMTDEQSLKVNRLHQLRNQILKIDQGIRRLQALMLRHDVTNATVRAEVQTMRKKVATLEEWREEYSDIQ